MGGLQKETPGARFELATNGLTVHCSTAELTRNKGTMVKKNLFFSKEQKYEDYYRVLRCKGRPWLSSCQVLDSRN